MPSDYTISCSRISTFIGSLESVATELSRGVLRSAFIEMDSNVQSALWYPLLLFLKEFPNSWELELKASQEDNEDDDDDNSENEDEGDGAKPKPTWTTSSSAAYQEFLQFLQLGCSGSPVQGYPVVLVVLSTIPSTVSFCCDYTLLDRTTNSQFI